MNQDIRVSLKQTPKTTLKGVLLGRLKVIATISLPEIEFAKIIKELESDALFLKLLLPGGNLPRVIRRNPSSSMKMSSGFYAFKEDLVAGSDSGVVNRVLAQRQDLIDLIKKIGQEAFERYFLYGEGIHSFEEIAEITGLKKEEVKKIHELVLELSVETAFSLPTAPPNAAYQRYSTVAQIEASLDGGGEVCLTTNLPHLARGGYNVNGQALEEWKSKKLLNPQEKKRLREILKKIELINIRQSTMLKILESVAQKQSSYFRSEKKFNLRPLTMRTLAKQLSLAPSTISRMVALRSIKLPWGEETPISKMLPSRRLCLENILEELLGLPENKNISDRLLANKIFKEFNLKISRRTINSCRRVVESRL